jgi:hypothetical protein
MNITGIKLVTGEDIIADVALSQDGRFLLKNAVQLKLAPPQIAGGPPSMGFSPFPVFAQARKDSIMAVEPLHVVYHYTPDENISDNYGAMFSSASTTTNQIITG